MLVKSFRVCVSWWPFARCIASILCYCLLSRSAKHERENRAVNFFLALEFTQDLRNSDIGTLFTLRDWLHSHHRPFSALTEQTNEDNMVSRIRQFRIPTSRSTATVQIKRSAWCNAVLDLSVVYCTLMWACGARCKRARSSRAIYPGLAVTLVSAETAALLLHS